MSTWPYRRTSSNAALLERPDSSANPPASLSPRQARSAPATQGMSSTDSSRWVRSTIPPGAFGRWPELVRQQPASRCGRAASSSSSRSRSDTLGAELSGRRRHSWSENPAAPDSEVRGSRGWGRKASVSCGSRCRRSAARFDSLCSSARLVGLLSPDPSATMARTGQSISVCSAL